jgi:hypothetical protein
MVCQKHVRIVFQGGDHSMKVFVFLWVVQWMGVLTRQLTCYFFANRLRLAVIFMWAWNFNGEHDRLWLGLIFGSPTDHQYRHLNQSTEWCLSSSLRSRAQQRLTARGLQGTWGVRHFKHGQSGQFLLVFARPWTLDFMGVPGHWRRLAMTQLRAWASSLNW